MSTSKTSKAVRGNNTEIRLTRSVQAMRSIPSRRDIATYETILIVTGAKLLTKYSCLRPVTRNVSYGITHTLERITVGSPRLVLCSVKLPASKT